MRFVLAMALAGSALACSTGGSSGDGMRELPSGGAGPFRRLEDEEVPFARATPGRNAVVDNGMVLPGDADAVLFFSFAPLMERPEPDAGPAPPDAGPMPDAGPAPDAGPPGDAGPRLAPYLAGPRVIHRSPASSGPGFPEGMAVLTAEPEWEGGEVFDPWAVKLEDGRVRLYYAAAGGIGAAEAPSRDGPFDRVSDEPLLAPDPSIASSAVPRRPTVVRHDGRWLLYYEAGGGIFAATSDDGLVFERNTAPLAIELPGEARHEGPGVVRVVTSSGRHVVRLYFAVERDDGSRVLAFAASDDGLNFERGPAPVYMDSSGEERVDFPAPWARDSRVTLLYWSFDDEMRRTPTRSLAVGVSPGNVRFMIEP